MSDAAFTRVMFVLLLLICGMLVWFDRQRRDELDNLAEIVGRLSSGQPIQQQRPAPAPVPVPPAFPRENDAEPAPYVAPVEPVAAEVLPGSVPTVDPKASPIADQSEHPLVRAAKAAHGAPQLPTEPAS